MAMKERPEVRRDNRIIVNLNQRDYDRVRELADRNGDYPARWIHDIVRAELRREENRS